MALEIEGKIIRKLGVQSGTSARGDWSKQEFIIEYQEGNYPSQACLSVWGADKVKELEKYQIGDKVKVSFNISSREYNNRWYTDLRAWKIESEVPVVENYTTGFAPTGVEGSGNTYSPNPAEAASTGHGFVSEGSNGNAQPEDDLPF